MERVCVTGAGGYVASWVVKYLLSKGYLVHGTVRDPYDAKNSHLKQLENAGANLRLFKADLLDYESINAAVAGCTGVLHVACPVPRGSQSNSEAELIEPAVKGTENVLKACVEAKVKKVVVVSSSSTVTMNPKWPQDRAMDEDCWSDQEFCKSLEKWYCLAKTIAEGEALKLAKQRALNVVTVCPSAIIGPMLQPTMNTSSGLILAFFRGVELQDNKNPMVDVRDVAEAILLAYEKPDAEGRYICSSNSFRMRALGDTMKDLYPRYNFTVTFKEAMKDDYPLFGKELSSEKLQKLGWKYRPIKETIVDSVQNYEEKGIFVLKKD